MSEPAYLLLAYVVFPLGVAAGVADWACHRVNGIAQTSGLRENLLHWLMFAQLGTGVLAVALLEINAAVLLLVLGVFMVHEATVWLDLRYSTTRRRVPPIEQMVHSIQALAIVGVGEAADWRLVPKGQPLPGTVLLGGAAAVLLLNVLPLAQETWACLAARARPRTPASPAPR
jgi:hypothetical protein